MKSLGSPRPWPPEACNELRHYVSRYGWARKPEPAVDDLFAILDELDGWLNDTRHYDRNQRRRDEWISITEDVCAAFGLVGPRLGSIVPSAGDLVLGLDRDLGIDQARRTVMAGVLSQVRAELRVPGAPGATLLDLMEAVKDPATRTTVINGRVDVLDAVLQFADRSLGGVSSTLSGILDNDAWYVHLALHELDGIEMRDEQLDEDAGLTEDERIDLATRWIGRQPTPAHHVVWLFYGHARADWRFTVGVCEFFEGPALLSALTEVDEVRAAGGTYPGDRHEYNTPPAELITNDIGGMYLRKEREWPKHEDWVGVRVDLGTETYPHVIETARDQVRALIALAAFDLRQTSWTELSGHKHFIDGYQAVTSSPFEEFGSQRTWADFDHTGAWLHEHQSELGNQVAAGPEAHAVVTAATALANTTTTPAVALLEAVRVIETQASVLRIHWKELVHEYAIPSTSRFRAQTGAFRAVEAVAHDHELFEHLPHLRDLSSEFRTYDGGQRAINMAAAVERLPMLVTEVPTYNMSGRRLRHVAEDIASPAAVAAFVDAETAREHRLLRRAHRVRNSLTHGGPANNSIIESASIFITSKAQHITDITLRALLDGQPPTETLRRYRQSNDTWTGGLAKAPTVAVALFPGKADKAP